MSERPEQELESGHGLATEEARPKTRRPPLYKVYLVNDDFTPMDFVVEILIGYFNLSQEKATQIMLQVHYRGRGVCGIFTREIAETKVRQVSEHAQHHQHPLLCTMEEV